MCETSHVTKIIEEKFKELTECNELFICPEKLSEVNYGIKGRIILSCLNSLKYKPVRLFVFPFIHLHNLAY